MSTLSRHFMLRPIHFSNINIKEWILHLVPGLPQLTWGIFLRLEGVCYLTPIIKSFHWTVSSFEVWDGDAVGLGDSIRFRTLKKIKWTHGPDGVHLTSHLTIKKRNATHTSRVGAWRNYSKKGTFFFEEYDQKNINVSIATSGRPHGKNWCFR